MIYLYKFILYNNNNDNKVPNKLIDEEHNIKLNDIIRKCNIENPEEFTEYEEMAEVLEDLPGWEYNLIGYICFHLKR